MRIFLDANVLFSAAKSDGAIRRLLKLLIETGHGCCIDGFVLEEARRNLAVKSPPALAELEALLPAIERAPAHPDARGLAALGGLPAKDRPVLAAAIRSRCEALVTGDRAHFGPLYGRTVHGVTAYSPRSLAQKLLR